jgi:2',3'-cyclic-nucleotide 2'-phosphodiesterase (5'-nucleotidase family)
MNFIQKIFFSSSIFLLSACSSDSKIKKTETSHIDFYEKTNAKDETSSTLIAPYKLKLDKVMNVVLGFSDTAMVKDNPEGLLGNFVADATLQIANAKFSENNNMACHISLFNNGGLRSSLPKGEILLRHAYELMPFDNELVILTITGENTNKLFQYLVNYNGAPFSGARVTTKNKKINHLQIQEKDFDISKNYKILTSDYLASGGDKFDFFKNPIKIDTLHYLLRDALIDYIKTENKNGKHITSKKDGRIIIE